MKPTKKISFIIIVAALIFVLPFNFAANAAPQKADPSGAYLKYTVDVKKPEGENLAYHFMTLKKNIDYIIQEGDMLEYDVYSYIDETGWGHIDGDIANVGTIRDSGLRDTEGTGVHTGVDLSDVVFEQWYHRVIELGVTEEENGDKYTVGRALRQIQIAMHPSVSDNDYQGVVLYDNIVITNNGEVKLVIFKDADDYIADHVRLSHRQGADGGIEMLFFSDEEVQAFKDEEERKIAEEASKEASREASREEAAASREAAAEASRQASVEQAAIDESAAAAEAEAAAADEASGGSSGNTSMVIVIGIAAGAAALVIIALVIVGLTKKKGGK